MAITLQKGGNVNLSKEAPHLSHVLDAMTKESYLSLTKVHRCSA